MFGRPAGSFLFSSSKRIDRGDPGSFGADTRVGPLSAEGLQPSASGSGAQGAAIGLEPGPGNPGAEAAPRMLVRRPDTRPGENRLSSTRPVVLQRSQLVL